MGNLSILLLLVTLVCTTAYQSPPTEQLIAKYSSSTALNEKEFEQLVQDISGKDVEQLGHVLREENFLNLTCWNSSGIFWLYENNSVIDAETLSKALPFIIINNENCKILDEEALPTFRAKSTKPTKGQVWGYGIGFAILICIISNLGAFLAPIMDTKFFERLLMFLVAMAVGTLVATALLVLVPEALNLMAYKELNEEYIGKMTVVCVALMFFFLSERTIKTLVGKRRAKAKNDYDEKEISITPTENSLLRDSSTSENHLTPATPPNEEASLVNTVAYIIVVGDGLHKFVDGLSVGAAFSENMITGMTVALAMICEEIAHEIGDVAILLHSGMSMKRALLCNGIAALFCFIGVAVGIILGDTTSANHWIFAIAGGIFLYVSLVDMLPEMGAAVEVVVKKDGSPFFVTVLQTFGLVVGFLIIFLVANYVGDIRL